MHRADDASPPRSRASSRRSSASLSRRSSIKQEKESKSAMSSAPGSAGSTPKKMGKASNLEFVVTGKQILKKSDRANSLPGSYRRPSVDSSKTRKPVEPKKTAEKVITSQSSKSQETSLEDDMSLDLSQVSDFEDTNSKYGIRKLKALATSTPKVLKNKPRSASLQSQIHSQRVETRRAMKSLDSTKQSFSYSRDSFKTSSTSSPHRYGTDLDYSSVSPEYSGQSSTEMSPRASQIDQVVSPRSQDLQVSSCCVSTWADCSDSATQVEHRCDGEWSSFWANYNNSLSKVPMKGYYDQCPTPYRTETLDLADFGDFEFSDGSRRRSPDNMDALNNIIRNQGLHLSPRETQNIIKCAHLLSNVLTKAIERRTKTNELDDPELLSRKKTLTLDLKETVIPLEVKEEKRCETATTQTDISLPNTKSAPRIFENILRQLSRSSIDVGKIENKDENGSKDKVDVNKGTDKEKEGKNDKSVLRQMSRSSIDVAKIENKDESKKENGSKDKVDVNKGKGSLRQMSKSSIDIGKIENKDEIKKEDYIDVKKGTDKDKEEKDIKEKVLSDGNKDKCEVAKIKEEVINDKSKLNKEESELIQNKDDKEIIEGVVPLSKNEVVKGDNDALENKTETPDEKCVNNPENSVDKTKSETNHESKTNTKE